MASRSQISLIPLAAMATFLGVYTLVPSGNAQAPTPASAGTAEPSQVEASRYFSGCNEARAAGAAPIRVGEPGYREEMDGDGDGIACESHRRW